MSEMGVFDAGQRRRWNDLRTRHLRGESLTLGERDELTELQQRILDLEAASLATSQERLSAETEALRAQNRHLRQLLDRKRVLVERAESALTDLRAERAAIDAELARLLGDTSPSPTR